MFRERRADDPARLSLERVEVEEVGAPVDQPLGQQEPDRELAEVRGRVGVPFSSAKRVLWASEETFSRAAGKLRSWFDGGDAFRTPKNGEVVEADLGWLTPAAIAADI